MRKGVIFGVLSIFATTLFAKPTLIKYKSGKATPNYAKKIQDMGNGSYKFVLDSSKEVKGSPLTPSLVKSSLEPKLKKFKSKVKPSGAGAVIITYKGDRDKFLKKKPQDFILSNGKSYSIKKMLAFAFEYFNLNYKNYIKVKNNTLNKNEVLYKKTNYKNCLRRNKIKANNKIFGKKLIYKMIKFYLNEK